MNVVGLTNRLINNKDAVEQVLEAIGHDNIRYNSSKNYFVFSRLDGDNANACNLFLDNLKLICYTRSDMNGDIYTLVMTELGLSFPKAIEFVTKTCGFSAEEFDIEIKKPFGGFYQGLIKEQTEPESTIKTYDMSILDDYTGMLSKQLFDDGISYKVQEDNYIGYDMWSNRITIPEFTFDGKICGIMGRLNKTDCGHDERWFPIVPCSRALTLYGYHRNYQTIKNKNLCIITESEKGPLQMESFGCKVGLGSCGCHISATQAKYIKGLMTDRIILAYDEGIDEEAIREEAKKLKLENNIVKNHVGYIYDREHDVLKKNSKASPTDYGRNKFSYLVKKCVTWI